jgi:1-acyl-sn-glycerol-3-phosphate acyltransferase
VIKILKHSPVPVVPMALNGLWGSFFSRKGGAALSQWPRGFRSPIQLKIAKPIAGETVQLAELETAVKALLAPREP